ncbi:hypothetical protein EXIGLDRAFT_829501 [Exidia glandulosa HHB12029]|uniref:Uncharacterized protein n=1 Tax=Exidia glandulosa HHB12029 TaxID=1314781 RepID=A0A165PKU9_EXIGL|nr:hypothetical protein EXIGLDRAFT_829501 [Exidia glandulosa HHB12029]
MARIAPVFRTRKISATHLVLPNELVLQIAHTAASSSVRAAKALALTCRALYDEIDAYRFRAIVIRDPRRVGGLDDFREIKGWRFASQTIQAFWWDTEISHLADKKWRAGQRQLIRGFLRSGSQIRVLGLSAAVIADYAGIMGSLLFVTQVLLAYDGIYGCVDMRLPFRSLTHLVLHAFREDDWPERIYECRNLTHLAVTVTYYDDEDVADEWATFVLGLIFEVMFDDPIFPRTVPPPPIQRFLLVLMEDGEDEGFPHANIYAKALREIDDPRVRIAFDSKPCSWTKDWWLQSAQGYTHLDVWKGFDPRLF